MHRYRFALPLFLALLVTACAAPRVPLYVYSGINEVGVRRIALMPIVDRRGDRTKQVDFGKLRRSARSALEGKGYLVVTPAAFTADGSLDATDVSEMTDEQLASLIPSDSDAVAVVYLDDFRNEYSLKIIWPTYDCEPLTSVKIATRDHGLIFYDKAATAQRGAGILDAVFAQAQAAIEIYGDNMRNLFSGFPKRSAGQ
jgi:hypothetical protein